MARNVISLRLSPRRSVSSSLSLIRPSAPSMSPRWASSSTALGRLSCTGGGADGGGGGDSERAAGSGGAADAPAPRGAPSRAGPAAPPHSAPPPRPPLPPPHQP